MSAVITQLVEAEHKRGQRERRFSNAAEREAMVTAYQRSGLMQREGIKYSTFVSWMIGVGTGMEPRPSHRTGRADLPPMPTPGIIPHPALQSTSVLVEEGSLHRDQGQTEDCPRHRVAFCHRPVTRLLPKAVCRVSEADWALRMRALRQYTEWFILPGVKFSENHICY